jgi:hypothetical protein
MKKAREIIVKLYIFRLGVTKVHKYILIFESHPEKVTIVLILLYRKGSFDMEDIATSRLQI